MSRQAPRNPDSRLVALRHLSALLKLAPKPRWATPVLVLLGLAASLAETLGITLVVAFLYAAMGQSVDAAGALGGWLGAGLARAQAFFGSALQMALAIVLLILARSALSHANRSLSAWVSEQINEAVRNGLHVQYLTASYGQMQRHEEAELVEILATESWLVAVAYRSMTRVVVGACSIAVFVSFLVALSWPITLAVLGGSAALSLLLRPLARQGRTLGERVKRVHQKLGEHMFMSIQGLRTIRAYAQETAHHERFLQWSVDARQTALAQVRLSALLDPITEVGYLAILCLVIAGAWYWGIGLATLLAGTALLYRLQPYAREVEGQLLTLAQIEPQLRSVLSMLRRDDKVYDEPGRQPIAALRQGIVFRDVTFAYEQGLPPALERASFEIPAGRTTALIGPSGAGKTTVINLLLRLYTPQAGSILVDGVPLNELRRADWLALLAAAGQDVDLIEGTVIDNIRMADARASRDAVLAAARAAGVDEFVGSLPDGYDTWIGQQGHRFSGGQRQRVSLARALLRDPQLLILDEAMSALDADLEQRIRHAIRERFTGRTVLIISHRTESIEDVDHVIRLDAGRVLPPGAG